MGEMGREGRNIEWGSDTCDLCSEETWLSLVLYEPVHAVLEKEPVNNELPKFRHPAPNDEEAIAVCGHCLGDALEELSSIFEVEKTDVSFDQVWKYLVYSTHPDYAEQVFPEESKAFE